MKKESNSGISFFQRYLTVWVIVCMLIGIMLGHFLPGMKEALNHLEYAGISIPVAVLIWIMIYPMMMKVDFKSIKNIGKNPKGLFVTWIVNWLIKPFTMYGIASFFFFVVFKTWENDLTLIAKGQKNAEEFLYGIEKMVTKLVSDNGEPVEEYQKLFSDDRKEIGKCPRCGNTIIQMASFIRLIQLWDRVEMTATNMFVTKQAERLIQ